MTKNEPLNPLPISKETGDALLKPSATSLGNASKDVLDGIFHWALDPIRKFNIQREQDLIDFRQRVQNKTELLLPENLDTSKTGLVLKTIEDSKYQLNEEIMRELFSTLISNTLDKRKNKSITPKFSEILSNMSVDEALLLNKMYKSYAHMVPTVEVNLKYILTGGSSKIADTFLLFDDQYANHYTLELSLLESSNLITFNKGSWLTHKTFEYAYKNFKDHHFEKMKQNNFFGKIIPNEQVLELTNSYYSFTALGLSFCKMVM